MPAKNASERRSERAEDVKRTVVVILVRAVGVAPLWKDSAVFCIMDSRTLARDDFKVGGGSVAGYMVVCLFWSRSSYLAGVVDESREVRGRWPFWMRRAEKISKGGVQRVSVEVER